MKYSFALPLAALLFTSCHQEKISQAPPADPEVVDRLEGRLNSMETHISKLNEAVEDSNRQQDTIAQLRAEVARLEKAAQEKEIQPEPVKVEELLEIVDPAIVRLTAIGESLGTVETLDGRTFYETTITRVTDVGIEVRHRDGTARLHFSGLPVEMRERFSYDPSLAQKRLRMERLNEQQQTKVALQQTRTQLEEEKKRRMKAEEKASEALAAVANQPVEQVTQIIRDDSHHNRNHSVIVPSPFYYSNTNSHVIPVVRPPVVRPGNSIRPTNVRPKPSTPVLRPTLVRPKPSTPVQRPTNVRPSVVRPSTPARPSNRARPVPIQRR